MKTAIATLLSSKKFWITIIGGIMTACAALLARFGLEVSDEAVQQVAGTVAGLFGLLLLGQGLADQGKEAEKEKAKTGTVVVLALVVLGLGGSQLGCATLKDSGKRVADDVVDCMAPALAGSVAELAPAFRDVVKNATADNGRVDWAPVKAVAAPLKSAGTRCAFAAVIAEVLRPKDDPNAPQSSALQADPVDVVTGFEAIRGGWGGGKFKLESGTL